jgi:hypothetical protein
VLYAFYILEETREGAIHSWSAKGAILGVIVRATIARTLYSLRSEINVDDNINFILN